MNPFGQQPQPTGAPGYYTHATPTPAFVGATPGGGGGGAGSTPAFAAHLHEARARAASGSLTPGGTPTLPESGPEAYARRQILEAQQAQMAEYQAQAQAIALQQAHAQAALQQAALAEYQRQQALQAQAYQAQLEEYQRQQAAEAERAREQAAQEQAEAERRRARAQQEAEEHAAELERRRAELERRAAEVARAEQEAAAQQRIVEEAAQRARAEEVARQQAIRAHQEALAAHQRAEVARVQQEQEAERQRLAMLQQQETERLRQQAEQERQAAEQQRLALEEQKRREALAAEERRRRAQQEAEERRLHEETLAEERRLEEERRIDEARRLKEAKRREAQERRRAEEERRRAWEEANALVIAPPTEDEDANAKRRAILQRARLAREQSLSSGVTRTSSLADKCPEPERDLVGINSPLNERHDPSALGQRTQSSAQMEMPVLVQQPSVRTQQPSVHMQQPSVHMQQPSVHMQQPTPIVQLPVSVASSTGQQTPPMQRPVVMQQPVVLQRPELVGGPSSPQGTPVTAPATVSPPKAAAQQPAQSKGPQPIAKARVLRNYVAESGKELSLTKGQVILILHKYPNGWWIGRLDQHSPMGTLPSNFVEEIPLDAPDVETHRTQQLAERLQEELSLSDRPASSSSSTIQHSRPAPVPPSETTSIPHRPMPRPPVGMHHRQSSSPGPVEHLHPEKMQHSRSSSDNPPQSIEVSSPTLPAAPTQEHPLLVGKVWPDKNAEQRARILVEILDTERFYVDALGVVADVYMKPLQREAARSKPILKTQYTSVIFAYLDVILGHNTRLLLGLEKRITTCMTEAMFQRACIGDLFDAMKGQFASTYTKYVINHPEAIATLNERTRKNKGFASFLKKCKTRPDLKNQTLESYLIMPVQRLPRYILLLGELLKHTPPDHPDYAPLEDALSTLREAASSLNEGKRDSEMFQGVLRAQQSIEPKLPDLISATRRLWYEGPIQEWSKNRKLKERYLFLFNDLLLVTQQKSGEKYRLRTKIILASCTVDESRDFSPTMFTAEARALIPGAFRLCTKQGNRLYFASSESEREKWLQWLREAIAS